MKCNDAKYMLDDYLGNALSIPEREQLIRHTESCAGCHKELRALELLQSALRDMPVEPAREFFARQVLRNATGKQHRSPGFMHWFGAGFAGAMVAGLVLWGVVATFQPWQSPAPVAAFSIALNQQRSISLAFNAPKDVQGVTVSIDLPEQFEVLGHEGRRKLTWKTDLKKGRNILRLPVIAKARGKGTMVARLSRKQQVKTLHILLATETPDLSQYRITSEVAV